MKRLILLVFIIVFLGISTIFVYINNMNIFAENQALYKYFKDEKLVGVDGEVNLSEIYSLKEEAYTQLLEVFQHDNYDYEFYLKEIEDNKRDNDDIQKEIDEITVEVGNLENKRDSLSDEYEVLVSKYNKLKISSVSVNINNSYNFPLINQNPKYPTGCESVALTMLLRYYGVSVTPDNIIAKLKKGSVPYLENGIRYGGNPENEFVGNPYSNNSYGVYEKPMAEVANAFKGGVIAKSDFSFSEVISLVQSGKPVMVWTSMGLSLPYISDSWIYKATGETIKWKANEHAVIMIDATDSTVVVADPIGGKIKTYSRSTFEARYNYYGRKVLYYL